jgi:hypothetical protein
MAKSEEKAILFPFSLANAVMTRSLAGRGTEGGVGPLALSSGFQAQATYEGVKLPEHLADLLNRVMRP